MVPKSKNKEYGLPPTSVPHLPRAHPKQTTAVDILCNLPERERTYKYQYALLSSSLLAFHIYSFTPRFFLLTIHIKQLFIWVY